MSRKSSDLFDVFNAATSRRTAASKSAERHRGPAGPGMTIGRRQILLAGSAMTLLMVLSFTVGVGVGRARRAAPAAEPVALARTAANPWSFRGRLPRTTVDAQDMQARFLAEVSARFPTLVKKMRIQAVDATRLEITVGPFDTMDEVRRASIQLGTWSVDGHWPFRDSIPEQRR